ncbi:Uncharacterized protein T310_5216 [Rasamsonia emersonii CBS 393.64]|uniref:Uncharacterized protein n=1 Tax=Rasamsonia emersonii (strain ATCC 16479 / CBS 393.64 / IMI 116815) TaxID=1408163 RepID=A0A0F4YSE8_RASE3|nr:Uncharacterized protein T310_5216 [Rasamsonia emersonii CBS 393.64]KKA20766.1 Uncharacterized protein T310_5216 [Rasamsonia emersonii CBS 393.64]
MAAVQGLRRPGASLLTKSKGLPSRPDEAIPPRKAVNPAETASAVPPSSSLPSNGYRSPGVEEKSLDAKPLPTPPELNTVRQPPRTSSLSRRDEEGPRQIPASVPRFSNPGFQISPASEEVPLDEFIPEPEPEPELEPERQPSPQEPSRLPNGTPVEGDEGNEVNDPNAPYVPPLPEPMIIPPLTRVHYSCYQSHRSMPVSNNFWYAVACMTCHKVDREIRHRCTFCCLRICSSCFQLLQKCKDRSLAELMSQIKTS